MYAQHHCSKVLLNASNSGKFTVVANLGFNLVNPEPIKHFTRKNIFFWEVLTLICFDRLLIQSLHKCLNLDHEHHLTALTAVGELAKLVPEQFCLSMKPMIASCIVKGLLMQDQTEGTPTKGIWCHDNQVAEETLAKV